MAIKKVIRKNPGSLAPDYSVFLGDYPTDGKAQRNFKENVAPEINSCVKQNVKKGMSPTEIQKAVKKCAKDNS